MRLHGAIDISQIKHTWRGRWSEAEIYYLNDVVMFNGEKFVCITTNLHDERRYGRVYMPTVANEYWQPFSYGYVWRNGWVEGDYYYPGDVVKWNSDWYVCKEYNFNAHPVYEFRGGVPAATTKWEKIVTSNTSNRGKNAIGFANQNPMGWNDKNYGSRGYEDSLNGYYSQGAMVINGDYLPSFTGRTTSYYAEGLGYLESWHCSQRSASFDFVDYMAGNRPSSVLGGAPKMIQCLSSGYHSMFLFDNGELYTTGYNGRGQIGNSDNTNVLSPMRTGRVDPDDLYYNGTAGGIDYKFHGVLRDTFIVKVASSAVQAETTYIHCLALDSNGEVWAWGSNSYGQIGHNGDDHDQWAPVKIDKKYFDYTAIVDIWANGTGSYSNSFALDANGQLWAWGYGEFGQLGIGRYSATEATRPVRQSVDWTKYGGIKKFQMTGSGNNSDKGGMVLTNDGQMWHWGGSFAQAGAVYGTGWSNTYTINPTPMAKTIWERMGDKTQSNLNSIANTVDIVNNTENFWTPGMYQGNALTVLKSKINGSMWAGGYNAGYAMSLLYADADPDIADVNNSLSSIGNVYFNRMYVGNMLDILKVQRTSPTSTGLVMHNADGRLWMTGDGGDKAVRAMGENYVNDARFSENIRLSWELDNSLQENPTQARGISDVCMLMGLDAADANGGVIAITSNNELRMWGVQNTSYPGTMTTLASAVGFVHNPIRNPLYF